MSPDMLSTTKGGSSAAKTITIRLSTLQSSKSAKKQQIIVIPHRMMVNGCISAKELNNIIQDPKPSIKSMENKRPSNSGSSTYGTDSQESSSINESSDSKVVRKRANLDHLSSDQKLMRRKLKNKVAAQNARDKKRVKMQNMEVDLERLKAHAKALEARNAQLVSKNERLVAKNKQFCSHAYNKGGKDLNSLPSDSLEDVVECKHNQKTPEKVVNQDEGSIANIIMGKILNSEACEQMLDNILEFSSFHSSMTNQGSDSLEASSNNATTFNTEWEEHFGDLFPDLRECTF